MTPHLVTEAQLRATGQPKKKARRCGNSDGPTRKDTLTVSTDKHTEAPPLDPHTLRVADDVLYALARNTPAGERYEGLMMAHNELRSLLAKANPRARVVVLPEPDAPNGARGKLWRTSSGIRVCTGPDGENLVSSGGALMVADDAAQLARAILAAAEFAGGAQ